MKTNLCFALLLAIYCGVLCAAPEASPAYTPAQRPAAELRARDGLPYFYKKLKSGKPATIVYFGGSITEQPGWRIQSEKYFKEKFPKSKIKAVNSAIGGTGSYLGAFRAKRDVIEHSPDLVFVEFAVNDSSTPPQNVIESMEGIVRQIRAALPETDICFVYTFTVKQLNTVRDGAMFASELAMEDVADRYGIPSINMCIEVARLQKDGKLVMAEPGGSMSAVSGSTLDAETSIPKNASGQIVFSKDGVHPYPNTGHVLYTKALKRSLEKIEKMPGAKRRGALPPPITPNNLENAKSLEISSPLIKLEGDAQVSSNTGGRRAISAIAKMNPPASAKFVFEGKALNAFSLIGPQGGLIEVFADGEKIGERKMFDGYCTYPRLQIIRLADFKDVKKRNIEIKVSQKGFDKRAMLFERNRKYFDANREKFEKFIFEPAYIMYTGKITPFGR